MAMQINHRPGPAKSLKVQGTYDARQIWHQHGPSFDQADSLLYLPGNRIAVANIILLRKEAAVWFD